VIAIAGDVLGHPLVILLAGTLPTGLLVHTISKRRQRLEKALEINVGLVTAITERVTEFLMAVQFAEPRAHGHPQQQFDAALKDWEVGAMGIRASSRRTSRIPHWRRAGGRSPRGDAFYALAGSGRPRPARGGARRADEGGGDGRRSAVTFWGAFGKRCWTASEIAQRILRARTSAVERPGGRW
jgi:hypothetical protein